MDLIDFLKARIDEDEAVARASLDSIGGDHHGMECVVSEEGMAHLMRHDPARVLADVAAKRAIVDDYAEVPSTARLRPLRWLAEVWRDHPDYDAEWDIP